MNQITLADVYKRAFAENAKYPNTYDVFELTEYVDDYIFNEMGIITELYNSKKVALRKIAWDSTSDKSDTSFYLTVMQPLKDVVIQNAL